jgi:hypothetical protein
VISVGALTPILVCFDKLEITPPSNFNQSCDGTGTKWHAYDPLGLDMAIPDYQALMLPVLRLAAAKEQRVATLADEIADELKVTLEERETMLPSGRQRVLNNRIHWAKCYMSKT